MVSLRSHMAGAAREVTGLLLFVLLALFAGSHSSTAQSTNDWVGQWLNTQTNIQTWSADFVQTRTLKTFSQPLMATGQVWFASPNRFRWELGNPPQTIAIRQPQQLVVIYPKLNRAEKYPLGEGGIGQWKDVLSLLEAGFPRNRKDLDARFNIASTEVKNGICDVVLEPKSAAARRMMPAIKIAFDTEKFQLRATELRFADGSTMRNDFKNAKINPSIDDSIFQPKFAPEMRVIEPLSSQKVLHK